MDGIPDFFIAETEGEAIDVPNQTWLDPKIVAARDTVYRLSARKLKGMAFCMQEIGRRTTPGYRILEVGMGTGHFTRWLAEVSEPGTEIYAFDCSWPIIEKARVNTHGLAEVALFCANARGPLPFKNEHFDILFLRLAPLGPHGIPNVQAGYALLKPGGWYIKAGWEQTHYEISPTEWAMQHGYESAEQHEWQYWRVQTARERAASKLELERLATQGGQTAKRVLQREEKTKHGPGEDGTVLKMTYEHVLIARKPL
jgi:SAM-dependent methyltransferase